MPIKKQLFNTKNTRRFTLVILFIIIFAFCNLNSSVVTSQEVKSVQKINQPNIVSQESQKQNSSQVEIKNNTFSSSANMVFGKGIVQFAIIFTFAFYLVCITVNYGYRTYWNSPLHPSFMPFVYVAVAAILAFTVVLTFDIAVGGTIDFEFLGQKFRGASGPVVLWILSFLTIMLGFRLSGATELAKSDVKANPASHELLKKKI
jgi:hypothetical protein